MIIVTSFRILVRAVRQFSADNATQMGAALAYYALFSIAPLLVLAVMLAGFIFGEDVAEDRVREHLTELVGPESAREVAALMHNKDQPVSAGLLAVLLIGALGAFLHVRRCLCIIWRLEPPRGSGLLETLFSYLLAVLMVPCVGVLLLLSLAASIVLLVLINFMGDDIPGGAVLWQGLEAGSSFLLLSLFFAVVFRVMSARRIAWGYVAYGSLITALLFTAGKTLIGAYLAYTSTASAYGAAGSLVAFL